MGYRKEIKWLKEGQLLLEEEGMFVLFVFIAVSDGRYLWRKRTRKASGLNFMDLGLWLAPATPIRR
jgi:hypothetical protein